MLEKNEIDIEIVIRITLRNIWQIEGLYSIHTFLSVVFPCMLIITQLLFQHYALVFIKSTRYYNLYFLSLYS
jgi:hypothetical protein